MDRVLAAEEDLREAACNGDEEGVHALLQSGVLVNCRHRINGWTPLHWAARRGYSNIVSLLLEYGAEKEVPNSKGEFAADVAATKEIATILGDGVASPSNPDLPFIPNYLAHPVFIHARPPTSLFNQDQNMPKVRRLDSSLNSTTYGSERVEASQTSLVSLVKPEEKKSSLSVSLDQAVLAVNGAVQSLQNLAQHLSLVASHLQNQELQLQSSAEQNKLPMSVAGASRGSVLLKIRKHFHGQSDLDFVDIIVDLANMSYQQLVSRCCTELGVAVSNFSKLRKLPNTVVRKDEDVRRLQDQDELELVTLKFVE